MKSVVFIIICLLNSTLSQDVRVDGNLLGSFRTTRPTDDVEYVDEYDVDSENEVVTEVFYEQQPDELVRSDSRRTSVRYPNYRPNFSNQPANESTSSNYNSTNPPSTDSVTSESGQQNVHQIPCEPSLYPTNQTIVPVTPIFNTTILPFEKDEIRLCPIGTFQNGSVCVQNYTSDCPEGYTWKNDHCVLSKKICPLNFEWNGRSCVQYQICPNNYVWNNRTRRCEQPEPQCPVGFVWNGARCQVSDIVCQPGSVLHGDECVIESFSCPPGFEAIGDECVQPSPICPPGFTLDSSGFCILLSTRCPQGSILVNEKCQRTTMSCPPGSYTHGNKCFKIHRPEHPPPSYPSTEAPNYPWETTNRPSYPPIGWTTTRRTDHRPHPRPPARCPDGFTLHGRICYRCPPNYHFCKMKCYKHAIECEDDDFVIPDISDIFPRDRNHIFNINVFTRGSPSRGGGNNVFKFEPTNSTNININNVTHPVTVNNVNEANIYIYGDIECPDGSIKTIVVKNNQTTNGCVDPNGSKSRPRSPNPNAESREHSREDIDDNHRHDGGDGNGDDDVDQSLKCCEVVTPRQCKQRRNSEWMCTHRRYEYCGDFCIADRLYLKPHATTFYNNVLTIAPSNSSDSAPLCFGRHCPAIDCSGCINGSFNCSQQCYTYPCTHKGCVYLDRDKFCKLVGGPTCEDEKNSRYRFP